VIEVNKYLIKLKRDLRTSYRVMIYLFYSFFLAYDKLLLKNACIKVKNIDTKQSNKRNNQNLNPKDKTIT